MSNTPRTDAASFLINDGKREVVGVEVSRQLEREPAESRAECKRHVAERAEERAAFQLLRTQRDNLNAECERLRRENEALHNAFSFEQERAAAWRKCADMLRETIVAIHSGQPSNSAMALQEYARLTSQEITP